MLTNAAADIGRARRCAASFCALPCNSAEIKGMLHLTPRFAVVAAILLLAAGLSQDQTPTLDHAALKARVKLEEASAKIQFDNAHTQLAMTQASTDASDMQEARMYRALASVKARANKLGNDAAPVLRLIEKSQAAWTAYREAEMELQWPASDDFGSVYPMCVGRGSAALFAERAETLERMLDEREGDVCSPRWDTPRELDVSRARDCATSPATPASPK